MSYFYICICICLPIPFLDFDLFYIHECMFSYHRKHLHPRHALLHFPRICKICSTMVLADIISDVFALLPPTFHVHLHTHARAQLHTFPIHLLLHSYIPVHIHPIHLPPPPPPHTYKDIWPYLAAFDLVLMLTAHLFLFFFFLGQYYTCARTSDFLRCLFCHHGLFTTAASSKLYLI